MVQFHKINVLRRADQEGKKKKEKESGITVKANLFYLLIYLLSFGCSFGEGNSPQDWLKECGEGKRRESEMRNTMAMNSTATE